MKKLLSILSIGSVLASTAPAVTACNSTKTVTKMDLSKLMVTGIDVTKDTTLKIHTQNAFNKIVAKIIESYKLFDFKGSDLKVSDFTYGVTPTKEHPWAIQIMNGNKKSAAISKWTAAKPTADIFPTSTEQNGDPTPATPSVLLKDNALSVKIVTTNTNVKETTATAHAYLDKFVYSTANVSKGKSVAVDTVENIKKTPWDESGSGKWNVNVVAQDTPTTILGKIQSAAAASAAQTPDKFAVFQTNVLTELNKQLAGETKTLTDLGLLTKTGKIDVTATSAPELFQLTPASGSTAASVAAISGQDPVGADKDIYIRLQNLGLANYIGNLNSYLYLKIVSTRAS